MLLIFILIFTGVILLYINRHKILNLYLNYYYKKSTAIIISNTYTTINLSNMVFKIPNIRLKGIYEIYCSMNIDNNFSVFELHVEYKRLNKTTIITGLPHTLEDINATNCIIKFIQADDTPIILTITDKTLNIKNYILEQVK